MVWIVILKFLVELEGAVIGLNHKSQKTFGLIWRHNGINCKPKVFSGMGRCCHRN